MKTVLTYGTFDLFHQGHYNILKRARALGDYLIVGVTGESYDIERGKLNVRDSLPTRIKNVEETGFADKIIIEEYQGQKINDVIKYNADILVVGSDWRGKFDYLNEYCEVVYLERTRGISSTQIRSDIGHLYRIGLVTDTADDGTLVGEVRYVSGLHVESVYAADLALAQRCMDAYELADAFDDFDAFLDSADIVYVHAGLTGRSELAARAMGAGKHVICDTPVTLSQAELRALYAQAEQAGVLFVENMKLPYLRAFTQLVWLLHGGIIGPVERIDIKGRCANMASGMLEKLTEAVYLVNKLFIAREDLAVSHIGVPAAAPRHEIITLSGPAAVASIELSSSPYWNSRAKIYGQHGMVLVPDEWWNMGFFEVHAQQFDSPQRYSFNFEGSGMRYLLQEFLLSLESEQPASNRFTRDDSHAVLEVVRSVVGDRL